MALWGNNDNVGSGGTGNPFSIMTTLGLLQDINGSIGGACW